ncbi:hypothetical protein SBRY_30942 [Actinacidiphila bryophytorum]|uniref:Uncharacterized protein n=1 Tax=Actinacidiphila bryophytorum TaxID=1436133 RepID=A0A9W4H238_9ACTN|nr:hypothetical protein SBRY_30942 [Actinacidiphila bryophytorum]
MVGVRGQRGAVHVDRLGRHEAVLVHQPDAVVAGRAPHARVRGDGQAQFAGGLEGGLLREGRVAGDVEGELEAEHVAAGRAAAHEVAEFGGAGPLGGRGLDVAVGQDEAAGYGLQRVGGGVGVLGGAQPVRPVDGGGHPGVEGFHGAEQVARVDVLRAEDPAPLQVVPDEVLREGPVGAVAAHRGLPQVAVGVDHAGHDDAARRVDLDGAVGDGEPRADGGDAVADDQHVVAGEHLPGGVDGQDGAAAQDDGTARGAAGAGRAVSAARAPASGAAGAPGGGLAHRLTLLRVTRTLVRPADVGPPSLSGLALSMDPGGCLRKAVRPADSGRYASGEPGPRTPGPPLARRPCHGAYGNRSRLHRGAGARP